MERENSIHGEERERAVLVGLDLSTDSDFDQSMKELEELAKACGMEAVGVVVQKSDAVHKAFYIGTGKVREVKEYAEALEADIIVFDNSLSPSQLRNLQKETGLPILDRTTLILDIFSLRAKTREARLQVESARLQYLMSRLVGMHEALTRQGGASGSMSSKGAGEKKLELDRRKIEKRIAELNRELEQVSEERSTQRKRRQEARIPKVSLVGYTNAGKSTMMNQLVELYGGEEEKKVFEKDMLFATLDTTVRKIETGNNKEFLLSDTVGFIRNLPHGLVKAFRSTLEEVKNADLLLYIIDCADPDFKRHIQVTEETLSEIGAANVPVIYVYNKADLAGIEPVPKLVGDQKLYMSAKTGAGLKELVDLIIAKVYSDFVDASFMIPYKDGNLVSYLMERAQIEVQEYREDGIFLQTRCHLADAGKLEEYRVS